jgi:hypothetical protein
VVDDQCFLSYFVFPTKLEINAVIFETVRVAGKDAGGKLPRPDRAAELGYTKCQFCLPPFIERQTVYVAKKGDVESLPVWRSFVVGDCRVNVFFVWPRIFGRSRDWGGGEARGCFFLSIPTCVSIGTIALDTRGRSRRTANKSKKGFSDGSRRWIAGHSAKVRGSSIQGGHLFFSRAENQ